jgi:hypothetical protein
MRELLSDPQAHPVASLCQKIGEFVVRISGRISFRKIGRQIAFGDRDQSINIISR